VGRRGRSIRFFTTKPIGQGTGLGAFDDLWICPAVQRPRLHRTARIGPGNVGQTLFAASSWATSPRGMHPSSRPGPSHAATGERTVLVVEDEPVVRGGDPGDARRAGLPEPWRPSTDRRACASCAMGERIDLLVTDVGPARQWNGRQLADQARGKRGPYLKFCSSPAMPRVWAIADGFFAARHGNDYQARSTSTNLVRGGIRSMFSG